MAAMLAEPWAGLLALAALLLWPGLLIVRAPWPFVPFLSVSFWLVSWDWLTPGGPGRERFLVVMLAFSALLSLLRLVKPLGASRPSWPTLAVVAAALFRLAPFAWWPAAPGLDPSFSSSSALLLVWRDGLPASYLPLYPIFGFGLGDAGLAALAADVSLLSGMAPSRGLLLATLAAEGLFILALFAFSRRFCPEAWSALGAVSVGAFALLIAARSEGEGGTALALALALGGASLVFQGRARSPRVAAGALWAGGAVVSPLLGVAGGAATVVGIVAERGRRGLGRLGLAAAVAGLLAAPVLWRTAAAGPLRVPGMLPLALVFLVVAGIPATYRRGSWPEPKAWARGACFALALAATLTDWRLRSTLTLVSADDLAAAAWLRVHSLATDVVCSGDEAARAWIPALAGRAASPPRLPRSVRAWHLAPPLGACRFLWGAADTGTSPAAFRKGRVSVTRLPPGALTGGP